MSRAVLVTLAAVLMLGSLAAGPAVAVASDERQVSNAERLQTPDGFDSTTFRIELYENGSARWAIIHYQPLENDSDIDRFESYANTFEDEETELYRDFVDRAGALTRVGTNETNRAMDARSFQRSAGVEPNGNRGAVRMSFRWTNFARLTGDRVVVSDVFEGGFYIAEGQSLVFEHDTALAFTEVRPAPDSRSDPQSLHTSESVTYVGDRFFNDSRPYVELGPPSTAGNGTATTGTPNGSPAGTTPGTGMFRIAIVLAVIALGAVAAAAWRSGAADAVLGGDEGGATTAAETTTQPAPETAVEDADLLDDSDRVVQLLESNGGRMKQVDIVETTDWSKSKVSMLLSEMEEDGDISKLRVGRENIISLAGEEPDAAGSPFDEE